MIKRIVTSKPKAAKALEVRQWANELLEYIKKKWPQVSPEVYFEKYGDASRMYWMSNYETVNELEKILAETQADEWFIDHYLKGTELFVDGSNRIILLESL